MIFVITVVIGILNGTDIWDPPTNTLLTHVHAGTLGWITLAVFGAAIWMFGSEDDPSTRMIANVSIVTLSVYVLAFWSVDLTDTSIQRPIGGTLAFIAMLWVFVWVLRQMRGRSYDVAQFGMMLALLFLVLGAILGVALGLQIAEIEIVAPENAEQLGGAHPAAMVIGYVILATVAMIEWMIRGGKAPVISEAKAGAVQMSLIFLAGLLGMVGFLIDNEMLIQLNVPLEIVGLVILLWRLRTFLAPSQWGGSMVNLFIRTAVVGLVIGLALLTYVISLFVAGEDFEVISPWLIALDHTNFIMAVTNLIFAMMASLLVVSESANRVIFWGANVGVAGFVVGLIAENAVVKRVFTPILGLALLYGIYVYLTAKEAEPAEVAPV